MPWPTSAALRALESARAQGLRRAMRVLGTSLPPRNPPPQLRRPPFQLSPPTEGVGRMRQRPRRFPLHTLRKAESPGRGPAKSDVAAAVCTVPSAQCHPVRVGRRLRAEGAATTLGLRRRDDAAASTACGRRGRHGALQEVLGGGHHGDGVRHAAFPQLVRVWREGQRSVGPVPRHSSRPARPHDGPRVPSTPSDTRGGT